MLAVGADGSSDLNVVIAPRTHRARYCANDEFRNLVLGNPVFKWRILALHMAIIYYYTIAIKGR